ncbi:hypothetical protein GCM10010191_12500 [Actinomadura vinacea]|uniref:Uncharacterized protein n=1 Tax=Actinomadura vinacea TaxID=115336 RepID=A0ABP5VQB1_9ACTN
MSRTSRHSRRGVADPPDKAAPPIPNRLASELPAELGEAQMSQHLESLRSAMHSQAPAVYARLERNSTSRPRLVVGDTSQQRFVTVTPPMNRLDTAVFRWGQWGGRIAPVAMPVTAAAAVLAALDAKGDRS